MSDCPQVETMPLRACVESFINEVGQLNTVVELQDREISALQADGVVLMEYLQAHGGHTDECNYIEELGSGRILKDSELELCDCGWVGVKKQVDLRLVECKDHLSPVAK